MTKAKLLGFTKEELIQRYDFKCKHGHNGISHSRCFDNGNEHPKERIGFADIETSGLNADFGMVYTWCIKEQGGKMETDTISFEDMVSGRMDKPVVASFIEAAKKYDRLIFHYGENGRFDIPFLRTRAIKWGLEFPGYKDVFISDTYPLVKNKLKLSSNRLGRVCDLFNIPAKSSPLNMHIWEQMHSGNQSKVKAALKYILTHNKEDVICLETLWEKLVPYTRVGKTTI